MVSAGGVNIISVSRSSVGTEGGVIFSCLKKKKVPPPIINTKRAKKIIRTNFSFCSITFRLYKLLGVVKQKKSGNRANYPIALTFNWICCIIKPVKLGIYSFRHRSLGFVFLFRTLNFSGR